MQVKVLYSFDNSATVFLSRSKNQYSVKVAQIPTGNGDDMLMLGAFDLKGCVQQIVRSSPENFRLQCEDYAVYYKDITEQPDEPFVANGVMLALLAAGKPDLIPGRVCQNLSALFLFGDKAALSLLTLEIRLKLHVIDRSEEKTEVQPKVAPQQPSMSQQLSIGQQLARRRKPQLSHSASGAVKATRTKSLPIFYHPPNQQISNIINADKLNATPRYDSKSIQERFNLAPFFSAAKIIDKPSRKRRRSNVPLTPTVQTPGGSQPHRAMRTRSMITTLQPISSPINEEGFSEATDDTEYNDHHVVIEEEDEEDAEFNEMHQSSSPYTPQHPPYDQMMARSASSSLITTDGNFQSLPDLEDLDSKKTHTIPSTKLPADHDLICINRNCVAQESVTWRYFETKFHPNYLNILRASEFDKKLYDGMFGPLCNACYLFLRNKGFMRPEAVVKKYLQQQKYKKDLKLKEDLTAMQQLRSSSPLVSMVTPHKFATPSHVPSAINEVIKNQTGGVKVAYSTSTSANHASTGGEDYQDLNDFMSQLNNFGGPLTDIDIPHELQHLGVQGNTPPMMATKSNTRVINLYEDEEDKENCPPGMDKLGEFERMMAKSLSLKSSPDRSEWSQFFGEPTPKDNTPHVGKTPMSDDVLPQLRTFKPSSGKLNNLKASVVNMPSSPPLTTLDLDKRLNGLTGDSSPGDRAQRTDTTMSFVNARRSSPQSEIFADDVKY